MPRHAHVLPADHAHYGAISRQVHEVFEEITDQIEPLALDEAFLDVSGTHRRLGDALAIGTELRRRVRLRLDLGCSVGVGSSKLIAKLASEAAKPSAGRDGPIPGRGVVVVARRDERRFLDPHPVEALWGVGPATLKKLNALGVRTIADLAAVPRAAVVAALGTGNGEHLHRLAHGIDDRPVQTDRDMKSISHEETFAHDLHEHEALDPELVGMVEAVVTRLRRHGGAGRTVQIKVRFSDFRLVTRSATPGPPLDSVAEVLPAARSLLQSLDPTPGVRLLGVSLSGLSEGGHRQLSLDMDGGEAEAGSFDHQEKVDAALDGVLDRFGPGAVRRASGLRGRPGADDHRNRPHREQQDG